MKHLLKCLLCIAVSCLCMTASLGRTQVLARPGWAGSGVAPEAWWLRGVFYRIDPARFQDSDGNGKGDLEGVAERLDYIQSLGVDALLLDDTANQLAETGFDLGDLVREASRHQLRVLVSLPPDAAGQPRSEVLHTVQGWLSNGVAGIWAPKTPAFGGKESDYAALLAELRELLAKYPGERVLLSDPAPTSLNLVSRPWRLNAHSSSGNLHAERGGQLTTAAIFPEGQGTVEQLRGSLVSASQEQSPGLHPLLRAEPGTPTGSRNAPGNAALLLASRGAVVLRFGEEIGLDLYPVGSEGGPDQPLPVMQWTPSNHTPAPVEQTSAPSQAGMPGSLTEFGTYHPYVPPPRGLGRLPPSSVHVTVDANIPATLPAPDTLPGFTAGTLPMAPADGDRFNVTTEDRDPRSLLNAYRQMIALHHGNPTVRNGTQSLLGPASDGTLVWIRRAPAGSRTAANLLAAANFLDRSVTLDIGPSLESSGMHAGDLRPLFASSPEAQTGETTSRLLLPPHGVLIAEIYHGGTRAQAIHSRRSGRRGRRIRR